MKGLRIAQASTLEEANRYLEQVYLPMWNRRFTCAPASPVDAHRPLLKSYDLAAILSRQVERKLANDYTLRWNRQIYQLAREQARPALRHTAIVIQQRLYGTLLFRSKDGDLNFTLGQTYATVTAQPPPAPRPPHNAPRRPSRWMKNFDLSDTPPLWTMLPRRSKKS